MQPFWKVSSFACLPSFSKALATERRISSLVHHEVHVVTQDGVVNLLAGAEIVTGQQRAAESVKLRVGFQDIPPPLNGRIIMTKPANN